MAPPPREAHGVKLFQSILISLPPIESTDIAICRHSSQGFEHAFSTLSVGRWSAHGMPTLPGWKPVLVTDALTYCRREEQMKHCREAIHFVD
jgi:hypothetical protein